MKKLHFVLFVLIGINVFAQKPVAVDDYGSFTRGDTLRLKILDNDYHPQGDTFFYWKNKMIYPGNKYFHFNSNTQELEVFSALYFGKMKIEYVIRDSKFMYDTGYIFIDILKEKTYNYDSIDINNLSVGVFSQGNYFTDLGKAHFRPKDCKASAIYSASLWIGGYDDGGNLALAAQTYRQGNSFLYLLGPADGNKNKDFYNRYDRLWKIDKTQLNEHVLNYSSSGYVLDDAIENWPAHGDISNNEPQDLANYLDINNNGMYDPMNGDCPCLYGDQMVLSIYNDDTVHVYPGDYSDSLRFEIHSYTYAYRKHIESLDNTIFIRYNIINRSSRPINKLAIGKWVDFDMGFAYDDYVGCDTIFHAFYSYNGDNYDSTGFGYNPPAVGCTFLSHELSSFMYYNNDWSLKGNPINAQHYNYYLNSKFKNGQQMRFGGDGFNDVWEDRDINYMFPSHPNYPNGWNEITSGNSTYDRRCVGATNNHLLNPGDTFTLDLAYVYARDKNKNNIENLDLLLQYISEIRDFYRNNPPRCASLKSIGVEEEKSHNVKIYPNPAKDYIIVDGGSQGEMKLEIISANGKIVFSKENINSTAKVDISQLDRGAYIVKISKQNEVINKSLIVL